MNPGKNINIVIVEDDQTIREGYKSLLESCNNFLLMNAYNNAEDAIKNLEHDKPDVVLMDLQLPGISGIEATQKIRKINSNISILVLTVHEDHEKVFNALCAGASGYLTKNISEEKLIKSIKETVEGGAPMSSAIAKMVVESFHTTMKSPLTSRETEVLQKIARGKSYSIIADELFISKDTVKSHIKNIYRKLEVNSKSEAIDKALKERII